MDWNPITHNYCRGCPFYQPVGQFIYELERDSEMRKCKYLKHCRRIATLYGQAEIDGKMKF